MAEEILLNASLRKIVHSTSSRNTKQKGLNTFRKEGKIPAILYGAGKKGVPLFIDYKEFIHLYHKVKHAENILISLKVDNTKNPEPTIIKEIQIDHVKKRILHIDFQRVSLKKKIEVNVPIEVIGESIGVKEGGILDHIIREIKVRCYPNQIPENLKLDVSSLNIGDVLLVKQIEAPEGVEVLDSPEDIVISIVKPTRIEEKPPEEAVEEEMVEPEVIKKGKKEEEEKPEEEKEEKEQK